jgi:hypothetical protein
LVAIAENHPAMLRKAQNGVPNLLQLVINFMLELPDDDLEEWINTKDYSHIEIFNSDVGTSSSKIILKFF